MTSWSVTNKTQLYSALSNAVGGDTVVLAGGNYGNISLSNLNYSSNVTITSAANAPMAHFDGLSLTGSKNITLQSIDVGRALVSGEATWTSLSNIKNSSNIKLQDMSFHGSMDNNPSNDGYGLTVSNVSNFQIVGSEFQQLAKGLIIYRSDGVEVRSSRFNDIRTDGINSAGNVGITLDGNSFTDFFPLSTDHQDAIQFYNTNMTRGQSDITITNNVITQGRGLGTQGIFINNPDAFGYKNVVIKNNLVHSNGMYNGLYVNGATDLSIVGNTVVSQNLDKKMLWIRLKNNTNTVLEDNITEQLMVEGGQNLIQSNNAIFSSDAAYRSLLPSLSSAAVLGVTDLIAETYGYQLPTLSSDAPPPALAPSPAPTLESIHGTSGNDRLKGTDASEMISGVGEFEANPGAASFDTLYGGGGADTFLFGDARGVFYDDGDYRTNGMGNFARIMDFGDDDKIQLFGTAADYFVKGATMNKVVGAQIFFDANDSGSFDKGDEMIAFVVGVTEISQDHFVYA